MHPYSYPPGNINPQSNQVVQQQYVDGRPIMQYPDGQPVMLEYNGQLVMQDVNGYPILQQNMRQPPPQNPMAHTGYQPTMQYPTAQSPYQQPMQQQPPRRTSFGVMNNNGGSPGPSGVARAKKRRASTVNTAYQREELAQTQPEYQVVKQSTPFTEPGITAIPARTADNKLIYVYEGTSMAKTSTKTVKTEEDTLEHLHPVPDTNLVGDLVYARMVDECSSDDEALINAKVAIVDYYFVESSSAISPFGDTDDSTITILNSLMSSIRSGSVTAEFLDNRLTSLMNMWLGCRDDSDFQIDSIAADYEELANIAKESFSAEDLSEFNKVLNNIVSILRECSLTCSNKKHPMMVCLSIKEIYIVLGNLDSESEEGLREAFLEEITSFSSKGAPHICMAVNDLTDSVPGSLMYLLRDDRKRVLLPLENEVLICNM